jgi:hypothetical protein
MTGMAAYQKSHGEAWLWGGTLLSGIVLQIALLLWLSGPAPVEGWMLLVSAVPFLTALGLALWQSARAERRRRGAICRQLEGEGFLAEFPPQAERAAGVFAPIDFLQRDLYLLDGAANIKWFALKPGGLCFFEHEFSTGGGRFRTVHERTVLVFHGGEQALPGAQLGQGDWFAMHRPVLLGEKRQLSQLGPRVRSGDPDFDRRWFCLGSEETAQKFLTDGRRRLLQNSPKGESWVVGHGFVCASYRGKLKPYMLARMQAHVTAVLEE